MTGNPLIDALVMSALLAVCPACLNHIKAYMAQTIQVSKNTVSIPSITGEFGSNRSYLAVVEWISKNVDFHHGAITMANGSKMPDENCSHTFTYKGSDFKFWSVAQDSKGLMNKTITSTKLYVSSSKLSNVIRFVDEAVDVWTKNTGRKQWTRIYDQWKSQPMITRTFDHVILEGTTKKELLDDINRFSASKARYGRVGVTWKRGYLLHGEPGTGKTSVISAIANTTNRDIYLMNLSQLRSDEELHSALLGVPSESVVVFEDIDCDGQLAHDRQNVHKQQNYEDRKVTLKGLLNELDGLASAEGRITILTTNHVDLLDAALIRPGRVDKRFHLGPATASTAANIIKLFFDRLPPTQIDIKKGVTPAQISGVCLEEFDDFYAAVEKVTKLVPKGKG